MNCSKARLAATMSLLLAATAPAAFAAQQPAAAAPDADLAVPEDFTFFAAGDLLGPYRPTLPLDDAGVAKVAEIIGAADAAFANQEGNSFDGATYTGSIAAENGGGYPIHSLSVTRAFKTMGLDLISRANNHSADYGVEGLLASDIALEAVGLTGAGTGRSLEAARKPGYFQSPKGPVALVATASSFTRMSPAGAPARGVGARPGISALHVQPIRLVTRAEFDAAKKILLRQGWIGDALPDAKSREVRMGEELYRLSDTPGLTYDVSDKDVGEILASVRDARHQANFVAFSIHAHETKSGGSEDDVPPDFLRKLFHDAIDAGADAIVRHGPHTVHGIEIYKGKPIFYSMGSLFFDLPKSLKIASDGPNPMTIELPATWYEGAVATSRFTNGRLSEIRIHPIILNPEVGPTRGLPRLATGVDAARILKRLKDASVQFGTDVRIEGDTAVITVAPAS